MYDFFEEVMDFEKKYDMDLTSLKEGFYNSFRNLAELILETKYKILINYCRKSKPNLARHKIVMLWNDMNFAYYCGV